MKSGISYKGSRRRYNFYAWVLVSFIAVLVLAAPIWAKAISLGTFGKTYTIKEKSAIQELQERANNVDLQAEAKKHANPDLVKRYRPDNMVSLPRATQDRRFTVDPTWTLDHDIPKTDKDGNIVGILYPRGFRFNPLDYMKLTTTYVVINADDKNQLDWFRKSQYAKNLNTRLLLSGGSFYETSKHLKRATFYLTDNVAKRMGFKRVPSIAYQKGRFIEIQEVNVLKNDRS